ncbi:DNA glycosylase AlkZ-like family protein [Corynebacterium oculi]|uniref:Winged helix DNA-binding domain-containing protein n=1 Tax=Corynebacterium oculi TaxID=1544416 RepID=A0A0Q0TX73_9CORY|nr:crosslink repair DNA glycosylase YcaQ family protein [Corynebacterium oculi]KQB83577.1 hypothetical protein Cocul_01647 [Corynebacterium oculi]
MEEIPRSELLARRLIAQGLAGSAARPGYANALDVARRVLALQGQTYQAGIRALALRSGLSDADVLDEVAALRVVRSWPQRGTLHFLAAEDARWLSRLLYPRVAGSQRGHRVRLGLSDADVNRARDALHSALMARDRTPLPRAEAYAVFCEAGIDPDQGRGSHLLRIFSGEGDVVQAPAWAPRRRSCTWITCRASLWRTPVRRLWWNWARATLPGTGRWRWRISWPGPGSPRPRPRRPLPRPGGTTRVRCEGVDYWMAAWQERVTTAEVEAALSLRLELPAFDEYLLGYANKQMVLPEHLRDNVLTRNGLSWPWVMEGGVAVASLRTA